MRATFPPSTRWTSAPTVDEPILVLGYWTWPELLGPFGLGLVSGFWFGLSGVLIGCALAAVLPAWRPLIGRQALVHRAWQRGWPVMGLLQVLTDAPRGQWPRSPFRHRPDPWWRP